MKQKWIKKFSLGLVLDTSMEEFEAFLDEYHPYIENFYFSLPLGDRFHSRKRVAEQFRHEASIEQFWRQLHAIRACGIKLEVLFNTHGLSREDVAAGRRMLDSHSIDPEKVGLVNDAYDAVHTFFPEKELVYSFNNSPASISAYAANGKQYAEYVIGRQFIRSKALVDYIHGELHGRTVLLVNNGCSHICGGCSTMRHCIDSYRRARHNHSAEYLYALQSIMPFELHEGWIDPANVDLIKINSRNTDIQYLRRSLQSYIEGNEEKWLAQTKEHFGLWAHLTWHMKHYDSFSLERIKEIKRRLYRGDPIEDQPSPEPVPVWADLTDRYIFRHSDPALPGESMRQSITCLLESIDGQLTGWCVGVHGCPELLTHVDPARAAALIAELRKSGRAVYFSLPPLRETKHAVAIGVLDALADTAPDGVIANDWGTFSLLRERGITVLRGAELDMRHAPEGSLQTPCVRDMLEHGVPSGMRGSECIVRYPLAQVCRGVCPHSAQPEGSCTEPVCLRCMGRQLRSAAHALQGLTLRGDALMHRVPQSDPLYLSAVSSGVTLLYTPDAEWMGEALV